jgi:hypothetical protein
MQSVKPSLFRTPVLAVLGAGLVVLGAAPTTVQARQEARFRREFSLVATEAGRAVGLKGKARLEVRSDRGREKVNIEAESRRLEAGDQVDAYAVNPGVSPDPVLLGTLTLQQARAGKVRAQLELKNYDGGALPAGLSPVQGITEFFVTESGNVANVLLRSTRRSTGGNGGGGGGDTQPLRRRINLVATAQGAAVDASGKAETETREDGRQKFSVEVESDELPAGTVVEISFTHAANGSGALSAGTMTLVALDNHVEGEVEFKSHEGTPLPAGADPVNGITSVTIVRQDTGETILSGAF